MAIFSRITNLTRGLWIVKTRSAAENAVEKAAFERELAAQRPPPVSSPASVRAVASPREGAEAHTEPRRPVELDADGSVKRSL